MASHRKRFTISVTSKMEAELDLARQSRYGRTTQNDMLRDLILRGLAVQKRGEGGK